MRKDAGHDPGMAVRNAAGACEVRGAVRSPGRPGTGRLLRTMVVLVLIVASVAAGLRAAEPRVNLEVATSRIGAIEGPQQWAQALDGVGFASVRLRAGGPGDRPRVEKSGTPDAPVYHVTGVLASSNELLLPDARIRYGDRKALETWLARLVAPPDTSGDALFGMTPEQIKTLQDQLSIALAATTAERSLEEVVREVKSQLPLELEVQVLR